MGKNKDTLPSNACADGAAYYNTFPTGQAFWDACTERPDWMLWTHARSTCPVPWAYAALAGVWAQDANDAAAARYAAAAARYAAARYAADAACYAARYAAAGCAADAAARKRQCDDIRAALPYFPGFPRLSSTKESV